jgi:hypothetical protein
MSHLTAKQIAPKQKNLDIKHFLLRWSVIGLVLSMLWPVYSFVACNAQVMELVDRVGYLTNLADNPSLAASALVWIIAYLFAFVVGGALIFSVIAWLIAADFCITMALVALFSRKRNKQASSADNSGEIHTS